MPSGFQQDSNQLSPSFYRVVWSASTGTYPTADDIDNGAINPYNWDSFATAPTTAAKAKQLARGNLRWNSIVEELEKHADCQVIDVEVTSADTTKADSQPTAIAFTVRYDRDASLLDAYQKVLLSENASNTTFVGYGGGSNYVNTTVKAIREMVTRGFVRGSTTGWAKSHRVYSPTTLEGTQVSVTIKQPDTPADVWADVTVNLIDGTEINSVV